MSRRVAFCSDVEAFVGKGNLVDLTIVVIVAGAFEQVVKSAVLLIMANVLDPVLKEVNVDSIAQLPVSLVSVALVDCIAIAFV